MSRFVVLLRGINLGAHNRLSMKDLRPALEAADFDDVRTHLQSGNVVVGHDGPAAAVEAAFADVLAERFDLDVPLLVRTDKQWRKILKDDPFADVRTDPKLQFVIFCSEKPKELPTAEPPEVLIAKGTELHAWCPDGVANGKLITGVSRKPPAKVATFRNWRTVEAVAELL